jgi:phosphohistidine phosphatase
MASIAAKICFLRHAEAAGMKDGPFDSDAERPLTDRGRARMERAARGMARMGLSFDAILTSPYVRARQTAEIVAAVLGNPRSLAVEEALASGAHWTNVRGALASSSAGPSVLLVGHEPDMSRMTADLLDAGRGALEFGKGSLAVVLVDAIPPSEPGILHSFLRLDQLEAMAG